MNYNIKRPLRPTRPDPIKLKGVDNLRDAILHFLSSNDPIECSHPTNGTWVCRNLHQANVLFNTKPKS